MMAERKVATKSSLSGATPPPPEAEHLPCPRCGSTNTKFCYYNNYNFSQPRHFCKACRRYWTHGGTLRDIPVGGGSRKNAKRSRTSASVATAAGPAAGFVSGTQHQDLGAAVAFPFDGKVCGSFTSLLGGGGHGPGGGGILGLGGFGLEDVAGFGLGRGGVWHFPGEPAGGGQGFGVGGPNTWQVECGDGFGGGGGGGGGGGDYCFALPELAISTPGSFMK